jgi:hypothetical protein
MREQLSSQKTHLIVFQYQAGQSTGSVCPGVNVNSIGSDVGLSRGGVAVHDDFAEIFLVQKKILANPEQVMLRLSLQGNAGSYAGVDEKEITTAERQGKALQKATVIFG